MTDQRGNERLVVGTDGWHLPSGIFVSDGPCGLNTRHHVKVNTTAFPVPIALAASWDLDLVRRVSRAIGEEAKGVGVNVVLGPCVNIIRHPLAGRTFESFSEDPVLSSDIAVAFVDGLQKDAGVGACVKHFACNNQETARKSVNVRVSDRTLREIYLPSFEACVRKAGASSLMTSYNRVNGRFASESEFLVRDVLRREWRFDGVVISDWGGCHDVASSVVVGLDVKMPGPPGEKDSSSFQRFPKRQELFDAARLSQDRQRALLRKFPPSSSPASVVPRALLEQNASLCRVASSASVVVLKNDKKTLPLVGFRRVAVLGPRAPVITSGGAGSSWVPLAKDPPSAVQSLKGCFGPSVEVLEPASFESVYQAEEIASQVEVAIVFVGYPPRIEGENADRKELGLPQLDNDIASAVCRVADRSVVVMCVGSPVSMPWLDDASAVAVGWYPGSAGARGIAEVLCGISPASGLLPVTWWRSLPTGDPFPIHFPFTRPPPVSELEYSEGVFIGYRWPSASEHSSFSFGHGLCYSAASISTASVSPTSAPATAEMKVSVLLAVKNEGELPSSFVVQAFVRPVQLAEAVPRPQKELRAWQRTSILDPGQSASVKLDLGPREFACYNERHSAWHVIEGEWAIEIWCPAADQSRPAITLPFVITSSLVSPDLQPI